MDATEQLVTKSSIAAGILGTAAGEVVLIDLSPDNGDLPDLKPYIERGFFYCGTMGYFRDSGQSAAECAPVPEALGVMLRAIAPFAEFVKAKLAPPKGDSVAWLESLWKLPSEGSN